MDVCVCVYIYIYILTYILILLYIYWHIYTNYATEAERASAARQKTRISIYMLYYRGREGSMRVTTEAKRALCALLQRQNAPYVLITCQKMRGRSMFYYRSVLLQRPTSVSVVTVLLQRQRGLLPRVRRPLKTLFTTEAESPLCLCSKAQRPLSTCSKALSPKPSLPL